MSLDTAMALVVGATVFWYGLTTLRLCCTPWIQKGDKGTLAAAHVALALCGGHWALEKGLLLEYVGAYGCGLAVMAFLTFATIIAATRDGG